MILTLNANGSSVCRAVKARLTAQYTLALLLFCADLHALEPSHAISQYGHTAWTRQNGGLQAGVFALTQTPDGDLWVGTEFGLFHFDGVRFLPWQPPPGQPLSSGYMFALAAAPDGSLWIGTRQGLPRWNRNRVQNPETRERPSGPSVSSILVD